ncbi:MAG: hypothetical protein HOW73_49395 [Polyangiaceae bacterium]|nr:hypothetical protein [Polyangiaceae bacterium]
MSSDRSSMQLLRHPVWIASLGLLVVNDHVLKGSGIIPGTLTGKLSDVAGMFVAPALLAALCSVKSRRGLAAAHLAVGVVFATLEMSAHATAIAADVYRAVGLHWASTSDWTDLLTLLLLPISYRWSVWASRLRPSARTIAGAGFRRHLDARHVVLAGMGVAACIATSDDDGTISPQDCDFDCDMDGVDAPEDCNDFDPAISPDAGNCPGTGEHCDNGVDDDFDGLVDCGDPQCNTACIGTLDACSLATPLDPTSGMLEGSTLLGTWALEGACGGADAPENVYRFTPTRWGTLIVEPPPSHVAYVRRDCTSAHEELPCVASDPEAETSLSIEVTPDETLTLVIDAADALSAADYAIPVRFVPYGCGDGTFDASIEECDDGNIESGDGCSPDCLVEQEVACASLPSLELAEAEHTFEGGTTFHTSNCGGASGPAAPERGFRFVAEMGGVLTVAASSTASLGVFAELDCPGATIACSAHGRAGAVSDLSVPLTAGQSVVVYVEGTADTPLETIFTMNASFEPN